MKNANKRKEVRTETVLITSLECIYRFPKINVPWTEWLIYSVVNKWGEKLVAGTTSNQFKLSAPLIAPRGKMDIQKFAGITIDKAVSIAQVDDLDKEGGITFETAKANGFSQVDKNGSDESPAI